MPLPELTGSEPLGRRLPDVRTLRQVLLAALPLMIVAAVLFAAVAVLDQSLPGATWNNGMSLWLQGPSERALTIVGFVTDWIYSGQVVLGLAGIAAVVFAIKGRWLLAASPALVFPMVALEAALKFLVAQPPASTYLQVRVLYRTSDLDISGLAHGFPSGHASRIGFMIGWLALMLVPAKYRLPVGIAAAVVALFSAWTRIYVGDHSLLEIVAGLLLAGVFLPLSGTLVAAAKQRER